MIDRDAVEVLEGVGGVPSSDIRGLTQFDNISYIYDYFNGAVYVLNHTTGDVNRVRSVYNVEEIGTSGLDSLNLSAPSLQRKGDTQ